MAVRDDRYPTLARLMATYYHQDWPLDASDVIEPFEEFVREEVPSEVSALAVELRAFLEEPLSEPDIRQRVEAMWGEVAPQQVPQGFRAWLRDMQARLDEIAHV